MNFTFRSDLAGHVFRISIRPVLENGHDSRSRRALEFFRWLAVVAIAAAWFGFIVPSVLLETARQRGRPDHQTQSALPAAGSWQTDWLWSNGPADWFLAAVGVLTAVAALATLRGIRDQVRQASKATVANTRAAIAAKTNADIANQTLIAANRPRLVVRPITVDGFDASGSIGTKLTNGKAWITNVGVLDAVLLRFYAQWLFTDVLPYNNPAHTTPDTSNISGVVKPGHFGKRAIPDFDVEQNVFNSVNNAVELARIGQGHQPSESLFLFGYIKYQDSIGLRRTFFCYRYNPVLAHLEEFEHPHYSYEE